VLLNCGAGDANLLAQFTSLSDLDAGKAAPRPTKMDLRTYGVGAQILRDLGVGRMRVMARPRKMPSMAGFGLTTTGYLEG